MAEKNKVRTPYNFVPFSNKHIERYASMDALPRHDQIDPALKCGEIYMTLRAETPVFLSDGHQKDEHFFRNAAGKIVIPGSTVRGMTRANMQILGLGWMRPQEDMDDYQIYYRDMTSASQSVGGQLKTHYQAALDIKSKKSRSGKSISVPHNVQAGYLYKEGAYYWIRPLSTPVLRISRKHPDVKQFEQQNRGHTANSDVKQPNDARTVRVSYREVGGKVKTIAPEGKAGMKQGVLLYTGQLIQENHLYLFPQEDEKVESVPISEEDVLSYQIDLEARYNSLKAYYDPKFWELPKGNEHKPVFFVRYDKHTYFGRSMFLRIGYKHGLSEGLPQSHRKINPKALDYPSAILGFARGRDTYRSRVSFGDFELMGRPRELPAVNIVLGEPKPSYYPSYVVEGKTYNEDDFRLRGYKQYWLKDVKIPKTVKDNVGSTLHPLDVGSAFRGVIRYKNLTEDELGLLLWSLRLDANCYQTVGKGKPYGFGRMKVTIDALREFDFTVLYTPEGLDGGAVQADDATIDRYIHSYDVYAAKMLKNKNKEDVSSLRDLKEIKDFFFMKQAIRDNDEVRYMELDEYKNVATPLEDVETVRKEFERRENAKSKPATDADVEALKQKFGGVAPAAKK